jgi:MarR family transcriptional regulator, transcriptional regulator for hemolysin
MHNDEDQSLGFLISDAARMMRTVFDRRVRELGLTRAQWLVLARLRRRPGASQSELAEMMEVEKASAGRMVDRLERKGWIVRRADPVDRRINRLYLTRDAEKISQRLWSIAEQTVADAACDLTATEAEHLAALLTTVKARLVAMAAGTEPALSTNGHGRKRIAARTRNSEIREEADADGVIAGRSAT